MTDKPRCCAKLVMGAHLAKTWAFCKIRLSGTCCKDCPQLLKCNNPCSKLYPYYNQDTKAYDFTNFECSFFITEIEAVFKRLESDEDRGVKE